MSELRKLTDSLIQISAISVRYSACNRSFASCCAVVKHDRNLYRQHGNARQQNARYISLTCTIRLARRLDALLVCDHDGGDGAMNREGRRKREGETMRRPTLPRAPKVRTFPLPGRATASLHFSAGYPYVDG
jgi:hypothetical protein